MISQSEKHRMHPRGIGLQQYMGLEGWPMPVIPPSPYKGSALQTDPFSQCCRKVLIEQHDVTPACIKIHYHRFRRRVGSRWLRLGFPCPVGESTGQGGRREGKESC
ncbi:hypothetical protein HMPREF9374_0028 [Desmospora sp. 8437]|nr:hypothetical protein HMPREF9374_0028 [Desmospora sp. 8437]